mmetsp:Transcript_54995/g.174890  ORF Transcript_54995/g.174890 Transcript_54995/m.174890 type:complete len:265 (+) Transcript_54995:138-932(+)
MKPRILRLAFFPAAASSSDAMPGMPERTPTSLSRLPLEDSKTPSFLRDWERVGSNQWWCYWNGTANFTDRSDPDTYVFRPPLQATASGVVLGAGDVCAHSTPEEVERVTGELLQWAQKLEVGDEEGEQIRCSCLGSESDYEWAPVLLPWAPGEELSPQAIFSALGAHPVLVAAAHPVKLQGELVGESDWLDPDEEEEGEEEEEIDYNNRLFMQETSGLLEYLSARGPPVVLLAGSEKINPVPLVAVGALGEGLVGGFMSCVVHT